MLRLSGNMGSDEDDKKLRASERSAFWCKVFVFICIAVSGCLVWYGAKSIRIGSLLEKSGDTPVPPRPYEYDSFMAWLRQTNFADVQSWQWKPEVIEFDVEAPARKGKFAAYLKGQAAEQAISAAKHINKFLFMGDAMQTGNLNQVGAPGTHLYILKRLAVATAAQGRSQPTFLDAGCGPGYLLLAWTLICGPGSKALGVDLDKGSVERARKYLADPEKVDAASNQQIIGSSTDVFVGDALQPSGLDLQKGTIDAVNVGLAVRSLADLDPLVELLRIGGLILAPICLADQPQDVPRGKCEGRLKTFQKTTDGNLERLHGDPEIPCRFIVSASNLSNLRR
jgi:SAM-dependent methyltransferase